MASGFQKARNAAWAAVNACRQKKVLEREMKPGRIGTQPAREGISLTTKRFVCVQPNGAGVNIAVNF